MSESPTLLDPTSERSPTARQALPPPDKLERPVALLDISKARGNVFLDRVQWHLEERGIEVKRYRKPSFARVAPTDLKQQITRECGAVIEALAD